MGTISGLILWWFYVVCEVVWFSSVVVISKTGSCGLCWVDEWLSVDLMSLVGWSYEKILILSHLLLLILLALSYCLLEAILFIHHIDCCACWLFLHIYWFIWLFYMLVYMKWCSYPDTYNSMFICVVYHVVVLYYNVWKRIR